MYHNVSDLTDPLVDTTLALMACRAGPPVVREIAAAAGVSPSLINYRFGSAEALRNAAIGVALDRDAERWISRRQGLLSAPLSRSDLAGLLNELLVDETRPDDRLAALRWLYMLKVLRGGDTAASPFSRAERDFWANLALRLKLSGEAHRTLMAFFHGLAFGHLVGAGASGFYAWSSSLVDRFTQRLFGIAVSWPGADSAWRAMFAQEVQATESAEGTHPTRQAILDAAVQILVGEGVSALTHRRLASEASASVSSVVYFFDSRRAILREAYGLLYRRLCERTLSHLDFSPGDAGSLEPRALAQRLAARDREGERGNRLELAGLLNAMFEASRDRETRPLAISLFARSGETSRTLLRYLRGFEHGAGWLDAQVFRLVSNGLIFLSLDTPHQKSASPELAISGELADALALLFTEG